MTRRAVTPTPRACVRHFANRFRDIGDPARAVSERAYMKSALRFHGVGAEQMRAECAAFCRSHPSMDRRELVAYIEALFATDWFDLRSVAIALLERKRALLEPDDAEWLVDLARRGACWAHVDYLVTKVIGPLLENDPSLAGRARKWARDPSFWIRRVALLAQLAPLRRGAGDFSLFAELATPLLDEREFFVQKAVGWVLREVSKKRPSLVRQFLLENGARCSSVTWREATKYLPARTKREVAARRGGIKAMRSPRAKRARPKGGGG